MVVALCMDGAAGLKRQRLYSTAPPEQGWLEMPAEREGGRAGREGKEGGGTYKVDHGWLLSKAAGQKEVVCSCGEGEWCKGALVCVYA